FGFVPMFGAPTKQLVIKSYSGGAHCCESALIADLLPKFRVLFNSDEYRLNFIGTGGRDSNGALDFCMRNETWAYFPADHAHSPSVAAYFRYDSGTGRYIPDVELRASELTALRKQMSEIRGWNRGEQVSGDARGQFSDEGYYRQRVLEVTLKYIYGGEPEAG